MKFFLVFFIITLQFSLFGKEKIKYTDSIFIQTQKERIKINVALAKTPKEWEKGLMKIKKLPENSGMLFIFPDEDYRIFWMKDTYIPLDIIFINSNLKIVGIIKNAKPMSEKNLFVNKKSKFVLEVNAGFCDKNKIKIKNYLIIVKNNAKNKKTK